MQHKQIIMPVSRIKKQALKKEQNKRKMDFLRNLGKQRSKELRQNATEWELKIKHILQDMGLQFQFQAPIICQNQWLYILDFYFPNKKMVIEIQSKQHHTSPEDVKKDKLRTRRLKKDGYTVNYLWNRQISMLTNEQLKAIILAFNNF